MADGILSPPVSPLTDTFGRQISYLRLSVTDRCDLRCSYCMAERMTFLPRKELLSVEELTHLASAFVARGIRKIRVTGGEPLVRKDIGVLFQNLGKLIGHGLDELTLTTNATLLAQYADLLVESGVKRVNVSLDTLDEETFCTITRRGSLQKVLDGIQAAQNAGLHIKINTVALKHSNVDQLPDMIKWAHARGMDMTLIEVMPLGDTGEDRLDQYVPLTMVQDSLSQQWSLKQVARMSDNAGPSRDYEIAETGGRLGFITPLSNNFCAGCNRIRVTCTGRIYMCLGQDDHVDLRAALRESHDMDAALNTALDRAMRRKPEKHDFEITRSNNSPALPRHMSVTGG